MTPLAQAVERLHQANNKLSVMGGMHENWSSYLQKQKANTQDREYALRIIRILLANTAVLHLENPHNLDALKTLGKEAATPLLSQFLKNHPHLQQALHESLASPEMDLKKARILLDLGVKPLPETLEAVLHDERYSEGRTMLDKFTPNVLLFPCKKALSGRPTQSVY